MIVPPPELVRLERVGSTMDALHELALAGAPAGTAVVAEEQVAGRGSRGRGWSSPRGGLWLSVLARPRAAGLELLSLRAGLAVAAVLDRAGAGRAVRLKWPNDVMLGERKTGGLLCEARWQGGALGWVAIGLGLNVTNAPPPGLELSATCLAAVDPTLRAADLAPAVIEALRAVDAAAGPLTADERAHFARRDWLRGRALVAPVAGIADGLAADGALLVRAADGSMTPVRAGTVVLARTAATADLRSCS